MSGAKLQSTLRELQEFASSRHFWIVFAAIVVLFSVIGPFGTNETLAAGPRFGFWLVNLASSTAIAIVCATLARFYLEGIVKPLLLRLLIGSLLSTIPMGGSLTLIVYSWRGVEPSWSEFSENVMSALPLAVIFTFIFWSAMRHERLAATVAASSGQDMAAQTPAIAAGEPVPEKRTSEQPQAREPAPLISRLKPENRGPILRLSAEDHYTLTVTTRGRELLLIRFSDALTELGDTEGMQIHRSHWLARSAFDRIDTDGGRMTAWLKDGTQLPVSRSFAPAFRKRVAEWL